MENSNEKGFTLNEFIDNNKNKEENKKNSNNSNDFTFDKEKQLENLRQKFNELKEKNKHTSAETEAETFIQNKRDIAEYNRWSLKLGQKWLHSLYNDKFWIAMGIGMMKYNHILNPESISLDVCSEYLEGAYLPKEKKILLCANTLTNYEKPKKFRFALRRHLVLMYDHVRSNDYDFKNCYHLACSEIRAAKLAGYCTKSFTYFNRYLNKEKNLQKNLNCVRNYANENLAKYYDHCSKSSLDYINNVMPKCFNDDSPIKDFNREKNFVNID